MRVLAMFNLLIGSAASVRTAAAVRGPMRSGTAAATRAAVTSVPRAVLREVRMVATATPEQQQQQPAKYDHAAIEAKWQQHWEDHNTFVARRREGKEKKYVLDMFPYPSGAGLHVGHPEGYTASDIMSRYWRMRDYDVLHPMGWDSFGLPAEQHAINTGAACM